MIPFIQEHLTSILSLPTIAVVAILGFMILKTVVKTFFKVAFLTVLLVLAVFFWQSFKSYAQTFVAQHNTSVQAESK
jgi:hypothetical protein